MAHAHDIGFSTEGVQERGVELFHICDCVVYNFVVENMQLTFFLRIEFTSAEYRIAGNIGGNYIRRIARKSSKIEIGGF